MASVNIHCDAPRSNVFHFAVRALRQVVDKAQSRWRIAATVRSLNRLDDLTLKDIGVRRSEIREVARRAETWRCR